MWSFSFSDCSEISQDLSLLAVSLAESKKEAIIEGADEDDDAHASLEATYTETDEGLLYHYLEYFGALSRQSEWQKLGILAE